MFVGSGGARGEWGAPAHFCKSCKSVNFFSGVGEEANVDPFLASFFSCL